MTDFIDDIIYAPMKPQHCPVCLGKGWYEIPPEEQDPRMDIYASCYDCGMQGTYEAYMDKLAGYIEGSLGLP